MGWRIATEEPRPIGTSPSRWRVVGEHDRPATEEPPVPSGDQGLTVGDWAKALETSFPKVGKDVVNQTASMVYHGLANVAHVARKFEAPGPFALNPASKDVLKKAEGVFRRLASEKALGPAAAPDNLAGDIYRGLVSIPGAAAEYELGGAAFGTVGGFASVDALNAAHLGAAEAFKAGAEGAMTGGVFKGVAPLTRPAKATALGAYGAAQAAGQGGGPREVVSEGGTLALLGAAGAGGKVGLKDVARDAVPRWRTVREVPSGTAPPSPAKGPQPDVAVQPRTEQGPAPTEGGASRPDKRAAATERFARMRKIDPARDDFVTALTKAGGIADAEGHDVATLAEGAPRTIYGRIVNNASGLHLDQMAQRLHAEGYLKQPDPAELLNVLRDNAHGRRSFSTAYDYDADPAGVMPTETPFSKRPAGTPPGAVASARPPESGTAYAPGDKYAGGVESVTPQRGQDAPKGGVSTRREDVLVPLLKAFKVPLYQGRIKRGNVLGYYLPRREAVRVKSQADIETTAHELAHLIDDRVFHGFGRRKDVGGPAPARPWQKGPDHKVYAEELKGLSYDKNKVYEGFAEFVRHWATQPQVAQERAPKFYQWWEGFLDRSLYGKDKTFAKEAAALREAQEGMTAWWDQHPLNRAASKVGEPTNINEALAPRRDRLRQSVADDLHGILRMEEDLTGGQIERGPYETARLSRSAYAIADGAVRLGRLKLNPDGSHTYEGKSLDKIIGSASPRVDDMLRYWTGVSAAELRAQGRERLFTKPEIDAMLALRTPEFEQAFKDFQEWNRANVDFAVAKGAIDPAARARWAREFYLPFWRVGSPGKPTSRRGGIEGALGGIKALKGGTANLRPILQNITNNAAMMIEMGLKNEARMEIIKLAEKERGGGRFLVRVGKEVRPAKISRDEVKRIVKEALQDDGTPEAEAAIEAMQQLLDQQPGFIQFWQLGQPPRGGNLMAALDHGKPVYAEVGDPLLFRSVQALNRPARNAVIRFGAFVRRLGQDTVTLTPDFMAANIARDTIMATIMSKHGFRPFIDSASGMISRLTKDQAYKDFIANGGGMSSYLLDEGAFRAHLERFYTSKGIDPRTVIDSPRKLLYGFEVLADAAELSTRLGEFKRAQTRGVHPRKAAFEAREVSTDFAMRGDSQTVGAMYDTVMFLKAAVNGMDRVYRGFTKDTNRTSIAVKTGMLALASVALYAINRGNPLYEEAEDWDRDGHWHVFVPTAAYYDFVQKNGREPQTPEEAQDAYIHLRYPKIWEIGGIASISERAAQRIVDEEPETFGADFLRVARNLFNVEYVPQVIEPLYEQAINLNRFTKRPIETDTQQERPPFSRVAPHTSETLARLGEATRGLPEDLQLNPVRAEALLRGYFNTWAMYGLTISDAVFFDDRPGLRVDEYPVIRRFIEETPNRHTRYETEFYEMLREATHARNGMRYFDKLNRPEIADDLERTQGNAEINQLQRQQKEAAGIAAEIRQIRRDPNLSPEEKKRLLAEKQLERNRLFRETVEDVKSQR